MVESTSRVFSIVRGACSNRPTPTIKWCITLDMAQCTQYLLGNFSSQSFSFLDLLDLDLLLGFQLLRFVLCIHLRAFNFILDLSWIFHHGCDVILDCCLVAKNGGLVSSVASSLANVFHWPLWQTIKQAKPRVRHTVYICLSLWSKRGSTWCAQIHFGFRYFLGRSEPALWCTYFRTAWMREWSSVWCCCSVYFLMWHHSLLLTSRISQ